MQKPKLGTRKSYLTKLICLEINTNFLQSLDYFILRAGNIKFLDSKHDRFIVFITFFKKNLVGGFNLVLCLLIS